MAASILLIDDDADDRELFGEALQRVGPHIHFESANGGQMAFDLLESKKREDLPDVIFLDINMPVIDGWQCLSLLKSNEAFKHIPVIIYSTSAPDGAQEAAIRLGALAYVLKPNQFNELKQLLARVVGLIDKKAIMKKITILFIQGGGEGAYDVDHKLVVNLQDALSGACDVVYPKMPNENDPNYESWKAAIDEALAKIAGPVVLVGHSVGSFLLLKYVLETKTDKEIVGLCFIATPFVGKGGWEFEEMAIPSALFSKKLTAPLFFYHGTDDTTVPFAHLSLYEKQFPQATFYKIVGRGHQLDNDLSEVAADIRRLI